VTNCTDYRTESKRLEIALWGDGANEQQYKDAVSKLGSSRLGVGRLWITAWKITNAQDSGGDKINWMRFSVEIILPK